MVFKRIGLLAFCNIIFTVVASTSVSEQGPFDALANSVVGYSLRPSWETKIVLVFVLFEDSFFDDQPRLYAIHGQVDCATRKRF